MIRPQAGKSLLEVLVIIAILSVIFGASTTTLAALLRLERQFRRDTEQVTALSRLAAHFRSDTHQAKGCRVGPGCVLTLPDGREVQYAASEREVTREVRREGAVEHRDGFVLPAGAAITFESIEQAGGAISRLSIRSTGEPVSGSPAVLATTIDAAVGLPRREARP